VSIYNRLAPEEVLKIKREENKAGNWSWDHADGFLGALFDAGYLPRSKEKSLGGPNP